MIDLMARSLQKYITLYKVINLVEELMSKQADILITVSEKVQQTFRLHPKNYYF